MSTNRDERFWLFYGKFQKGLFRDNPDDLSDRVGRIGRSSGFGYGTSQAGTGRASAKSVTQPPC